MASMELRANVFDKLNYLLAQRRHEYRSFVVHEHYKLVYYINEDTLYIVDLWDTRRKPKGLAHRIQT